ncbi:MAG: hypothetical protein JW861_06945 [Bacteroidales bacterium]|nr:hypothetical protein [Bacteroidales bacterium]
MRRRRKAYLREERASIRRQRRLQQQQRRRHRMIRSRELWHRLVGLFVRRRPTEPTGDSGKRFRRLKARERRKKYAREERESLRRERRMMREKTRPMRRRMRKQRMDYLRKRLLQFIRNPIPVRRISSQQRFIIRQVRRERRKEFRKQLARLPVNMGTSIARFWYHRAHEAKTLTRAVSDFMFNLAQVSRDTGLRRTLIAGTVNSTAFYVLAFIGTYMLSQYITIVTASFYDIPTKLYSYRIYWPLYTYSTLYTRGALIVIFGMGPLVCLILGLVFYRIYLWLCHRTLHLKIFLIWIVIHFLNNFFGAYISGVITRTGFIYTSEWLFLSNILDTEEILFLIISVVALIVVGYFSTRHFLSTASMEALVVPKNRQFFLLGRVLIPWIFGNLILVAINMPNNPGELLILYLTSVLVVVPVFTNYNQPSLGLIRLGRTTRLGRPAWLYILITAGALALLRFGLANGVSFG